MFIAKIRIIRKNSDIKNVISEVMYKSAIWQTNIYFSFSCQMLSYKKIIKNTIYWLN